MIWCGIDWAERHHDVALVDDDGKLIAKRRVGDDLSGFTALLELLTEHRAISNGECAIPIAIETANGLLPAALLASGFTVYAINPLAASRYRDRYAVSRAKSDAGDALVLANVPRTDRSAHRPIPADSELVRAVRVLARASKTRSGSVNKPRTSSGRYSASTTRPHWPPSMISLPRLRGKCSLWHQPPTTLVGCAEPHSERQ
jgi:transposase